MTASRLSESCLLAAALLALVSAPARAQAFNVKLGLWEVSSMNEGMGSKEPHTSKQCLTKEKLDKELFEDKKLDPSCKRTMVAETATLREFDVVCTGERAMNVHGRFQAVTPEAVKGSIKLAQNVGGQMMNMTSDVTAKWIGPSCGDVK